MKTLAAKSKRSLSSSVMLGLMLVSTNCPVVFADAPPGAYLNSTVKTQKPAGQKVTQPNSGFAAASPATGGDTKYGQPLGDSLNPSSASQAMPSSGGWNSNPDPSQQNNQSYSGSNQQSGYNQPPGNSGSEPSAFQAPQQGQVTQQAPYSGYAQQNNYAPPTGYAAPAPPNNMGGQQGGWQADYPSMTELNGGAQTQQNAAPQYNQNVQYGQPLGQQPMQSAPPNWGGGMYPPPAAVAPPPAKAAVTKTAHTDDDDNNNNKTLNAIANTVLPIATSVVTTAIMNKMMYGRMAPGMGGYPSGYGGNPYMGNPYGGIRNPMGGYGYGRPGFMNGLMGGGGMTGGLLNNMRF